MVTISRTVKPYIYQNSAGYLNKAVEHKARQHVSPCCEEEHQAGIVTES
jgi:hypothetical protein